MAKLTDTAGGSMTGLPRAAISLIGLAVVVRRSRLPLALVGLLVVGAVVVACSPTRSDAGPPDLRGARSFTAFPLYWLGERFERWPLSSVDALSGPQGFVSLIYGDCTPRGADHATCVPPIEIQISALCSHLTAVARSPAWRHRRIRGAPVGTIDDAPVLFTDGAQVKVYRGEGTDPGVAVRALLALRSLNRVAPVLGATGRIPRPPLGVLSGRRPCTEDMP